jgi:hypothetical protein
MYFPSASFRDRCVSAHEAATALLTNVKRFPDVYLRTEKEKKALLPKIDKLIAIVEQEASHAELSKADLKQAVSFAIDSLGTPDFENFRSGIKKLGGTYGP